MAIPVLPVVLTRAAAIPALPVLEARYADALKTHAGAVAGVKLKARISFLSALQCLFQETLRGRNLYAVARLLPSDDYVQASGLRNKYNLAFYSGRRPGNNGHPAGAERLHGGII